MRYISKYHPVVDCEYCGRQLSKQNYREHVEKCFDNPTVIKQQKEQILVCENCGKEYSYYENQNLRFCSKPCSKSFASKKNNSNETKDSICIVCGKNIEIKKNASHKTAICESCKSNKRKKDIYYCQYCGRKIVTKSNIIRHENSCVMNPNQTHRKYKKHKDNNKGYIYKVTNQINGKSYIGKKHGNITETKKYFGSGIAIKEAIEKYGQENFIKEILEIVDGYDLNERERYWIEYYNTYGNGYNMTVGGDGSNGFEGRKHTKETIEKIKNYHKIAG